MSHHVKRIFVICEGMDSVERIPSGSISEVEEKVAWQPGVTSWLKREENEWADGRTALL